jgi:drug/metabolite transporter (DMT)-like permease
MQLSIGEACALGAAAAWATGSMLFSRIGRLTSPGAMNVGKCVSAALMLIVTQLVLGHSPLPQASAGAWGLLAASALIGLTLGDTAYFTAMVAIGVPRAMLLLSTAPLFAVLFGWVWLHERLGLRALFGIALTLAGIGLVIARRDVAAVADESARRRGIALGVVAGIAQAAGSILSRRAMHDGIDPIAAASGRLAIGAIGLLAVGAFNGRSRGWIGELATERTWLRVAGASVVGTYFGISLAQIGLARAHSTGVASTLLATSPIFALPLAHFTGVERITARTAFGGVLAVAGIGVLSIGGG